MFSMDVCVCVVAVARTIVDVLGSLTLFKYGLICSLVMGAGGLHTFWQICCVA